MTERDTRALARRLMTEYGLLAQGWRFGFDRARTRCGRCSYPNRLITLSRHYIARNSDADVENTIRHEIAHALVGRGHGHKYAWRAMAVRVGARPERCNARADMPAATFRRFRCKGCGVEWTQHRVTRSVLLRFALGVRWHARCGRAAGQIEVLA